MAVPSLIRATCDVTRNKQVRRDRTAVVSLCKGTLMCVGVIFCSCENRFHPFKYLKRVSSYPVHAALSRNNIVAGSPASVVLYLVQGFLVPNCKSLNKVADQVRP